MGRRGMRATLLAALALAALPPAAAAAAAPFGHACAAQDGVRLCTGERVPTFDGVPLDVDVTLPPEGDGPFPTIVMLHGYGGSKANYQASSPEGDGGTTYHWNSNHFARRGYAVVNYSARGFGESCGRVDSRGHPGCAKGWIHLAHQDFEARDTQHLLGLLVDQGVARAEALGATGISYGGGQTLELAYQRWTSPGGTSLKLAAAYPRWLWSDLVNSLLPNGRYLDFRNSSASESREPLGVPIQSYIAGLYALGNATGFYAPPGADPSADVTLWFARVNAGEPYGADARAIADEIHAHHQGFGLGGGFLTPAPLLLHGGWTDDLFPSSEPLRIYNEVRAADRGAPVSLQLADLGHARGSNKPDADKVLNDAGSAFFDHYLKGEPGGPAPGSVTAFLQTCPQDAPAGPPVRAASWPEIHPGAVTFGDPRAQTVSSAGGNPATAQAMDPISGGGDACRSVAGEAAPGTANYSGTATSGYTLIGRPTIIADIEASGPHGQLAARLWDVAPDGRQVLVTRGVYRLLDDQKGSITFQLNGNGYRFAAGHAPKLELLGRDQPYLRPSNGEFSVRVANLKALLPVLEHPGSRPGIGALPPGLQAFGRRRARLETRSRLSRGHVLTTTGRLRRPAGLSRSDACRGRVTVRVRAGRRTISARRASVRTRSCRFASRVRFGRPSRFGAARRLIVRARFGGNAVLLPATAKPRRIRLRR